MKKLITTLLAASGLAFAAPSFAGADSDCHFHGKAPAAKDTVSGCAVKYQQALLESGKLDKSWAAVKPTETEQIDGAKGKEWRVVFKNPAAADKTKDTLYMFYTLQGNRIAVNFTGK
jgi:hypothetical protein